MDFSKQMGEIHSSICNELAFYDVKKNIKKEGKPKQDGNSEDQVEVRQSKRLKKE